MTEQADELASKISAIADANGEQTESVAGIEQTLRELERQIAEIDVQATFD